MPKKIARGLVALLLLGSGTLAQATTEWSAQDYNLYSGDFNGDGKADILYVAKDPSKASGIAIGDGTNQPNTPWQSWPSNFLNIPWSGNIYNIIVADFNGDGKVDIFMQSTVPGDSYLLITGANGKVVGIYQTLAYAALGANLAWGANQHRLVAGDFNHDGRADLFVQSTSTAGTNGVALANSDGTFTAVTQTWLDGYLGFKWSTQNANVFAGDFNGDGYADLLIQAKPKFITVNYDVPFPVPTYPPNLNGLVKAQAGTTPFVLAGVQAWSRKNNGVDWSPLSSVLIVGDFNGDGRADMVLQARYASGSSYLLTGNASGTAFGSSGTVLSGNIGLVGATLIAGKFGGGAASLYVQTALPTGSNYLIGTVGAGFTAAAQNPSLGSGAAAATAVGWTPGSLSVTNQGGAAYSIPIVVPPGVAQIQPQLAITYQSSGGNGLLGFGWGLSGLSEIERCRGTIAQDGSSSAVTLTLADKFCLDGNRLRLTGAIAYGAPGSSYQTEAETFARITASGAAGNGPAYFTVEAKNGLKYEYGNSLDSAIESTAPGFTTTRRVWALDKVSDRYGNTMTISYQEDGAAGNGSFRPVQMLYTSNVAAVLAASYKVVFVWEARPPGDVLTQYVAGGLIRETYRLNRIETQFNDPAVGAFRLVRKYQVSYINSSVTSRSLVAAIQECDTNGLCLSPTTVGWQDGNTSLGAETLYQNLGNGVQYALPIDINGDGRTDLVYPTFNSTSAFASATCTWMFALANGSGGYSAPQPVGYTGTHCDTPLALDYNSDGRADFMIENASGNWQVFQSTGTGFTAIPTSLAAPAAANKAWIADVNGDGRPDLVYVNADNVTLTVATNTGSGLSVTGSYAPLPSNGFFNTTAGSGPAFYVLSQSALAAIDANSDGKSDFLVSYYTRVASGFSYNFTYYIGLMRTVNGVPQLDATPLVSSSSSSTIDSIFTALRGADLNGDGNIDLLYPCPSNAAVWCVRFGTGAGLGAEVVTAASTGSNVAQALAFDWNGDNRADILEPTSTGVWTALIATGNTGEPVFVTSPTTISTSGLGAARVIDLNGDGLLDLGIVDTSFNWKYRLHTAPIPDLVTSINDGFGNSQGISYAPLTDTTVYTQGSGATFPEVDFTAPIYVVKQTTSSDGVGGQFTRTQSYTGARAHLQGRGIEGFASRTETDSRTGVMTTTGFNQPVGTQWPFAFLSAVTSITVKQPNGRTISQVNTHYTDLITNATAFADRHFPYVDTETRVLNEVSASDASVDGQPMSKVVTTTSVDVYGTPTVVSASTYDMTVGTGVLAQTATTDSGTPTNDTTYWCLGFVTREQLTKTAPGLSSVTRTSDTVKDVAAPSLCRASQRIIEPTDPAPYANKLTTTYGYDGFGHLTSQSVSGANISARITRSDYGTQGILPVSVTNAENETAASDYYYDLGVPKSNTDANGLVTSWTYDGYGRKKSESHSDGTSVSWTLYRCGVANGYCGDPLLRYEAVEQQKDSAGIVQRVGVQMLDAMGRVKYAQSQTVDGNTSNVATLYDNQGRVTQQSLPFISGAAANYSTIAFDLLGRVLSETHRVSDADATLQSSQYTYARLTRTFKDANIHSTIKVLNALGQVVQVTDGRSGLTKYEYDVFGNLTKTTDPAGNQSSFHYNVRGFKDYSDDADLGHWTYTYYPTGELWTQSDAKLQQVTFGVDRVGRPISRSEVEGASSWSYGTALTYTPTNRNIGKVLSISAPGGYSESYTYDALGRVQDQNTTADGSSYTVSRAYKPNTGLLETLTYPAVTISGTTSRFQVQYDYSFGFLKDVKDAATVYWQKNAANATGLAIDEQFGNGLHSYSNYDSVTGRLINRTTGATGQVQNLSYVWDKVGNLGERKDVNLSLTEDFFYDELNRLDYSKLNGNINLDPTYDATGNITAKSDIGSYDYVTAQAACNYTGLTAQPHAVRKAGSSVYCYDKNGNMTSRGGSTLSWTSYNLPSQLYQGANYSTFSYGADRSRYKEVAYVSAGGVLPAGTESTISIGGVFERVTKPSGIIEYRHNIMAGTEVVAIRTLRSNAVSDTRYLHKDHLGSVDAVTNEMGAVVLRASFDAFGNRRNTSTWSGSPAPGDWTTIAATTHRGYTYHEQLDNVSLVHMNGRVYDPIIGRFLSADSVVQAPLMSQSLNRYSYVVNNPLSLVDPSGYSWLSKLIDRIWRPVLAIIVAALAYNYGAPFFSQLLSSTALAPGTITTGGAALAGGLAAALSTAVLGGSGSDILRAFAVAALLAYGSSKFADYLAEMPGDDGYEIGLYKFQKGQEPLMITDYSTVPKGSYLFTDGMMTSLQHAAELSYVQTGQSVAYGFYNPTNGFWRDLLESFVEKMSPTSQLGNRLADVLQATNGQWAEIVAHSQGSIILSNAMRTLALRGVTMSSSTVITYYGAAANRWLATALAHDIGIVGRVGGLDHYGDAVGNIVGFNTWNIGRVLASIFEVPLLFTNSSPHSCYPNYCGQ